MIITRTPYRISLFGGGSDYPEWLTENRGATLSFTIPSFSNLFLRRLSPVFESKYRIRYYRREEVRFAKEINHPIIRHVITQYLSSGRLGSQDALDIIHSGDFPARTGLGTSSCFTVGLLKALDAFTGTVKSKQDLAKEAIYIEQKLNGETVGCQDQIAAAFGGLNFVEYSSPVDFSVCPLNPPTEWIQEFCDSLFLVYSGLTRDSSGPAIKFVSRLSDNKSTLRDIIALADEARSIIESRGDMNYIGRMLHEAWSLKKSCTEGISSVDIDTLYQDLRTKGAAGGKLLGAGAGGFLLVYVPRPRRKSFLKSNSSRVLLPIKIDWEGCKAIELETSHVHSEGL